MKYGAPLAVAASTGSVGVMRDQPLLATLLELERAGWDALCRGEGADFYGEIMTYDAIMLLAGGLALDKDAVLASLGEAPAWDSYEISDERLIDLGPTSAALLYTARASIYGERPFVALMTSVYLQDDYGWRLALYQQTPITQNN